MLFEVLFNIVFERKLLNLLAVGTILRGANYIIFMRLENEKKYLIWLKTKIYILIKFLIFFLNTSLQLLFALINPGESMPYATWLYFLIVLVTNVGLDATWLTVRILFRRNFCGCWHLCFIKPALSRWDLQLVIPR